MWNLIPRCRHPGECDRQRWQEYIGIAEAILARNPYSLINITILRGVGIRINMISPVSSCRQPSYERLPVEDDNQADDL